jgi:hypothetical protein
MTPVIRFIHLIMQEYDSKCLRMFLITLKVFKIYGLGMAHADSSTFCDQVMKVFFDHFLSRNISDFLMDHPIFFM